MVSIAEKLLLLLDDNRLAAYNARVLKKSPLRYFPMVSDTSILDDISANDDDGTYTGATLQSTPGPFGGLAPLFDGNNDYASPYSAAFASAIDLDEGAVLIWFKAAGSSVWTDGVERQLINLFDDGNNQVYMRKRGDNTIRVVRGGGGGFSTIDVGSITTVGWASLLMSWSITDDEYRVYLNGSQSGSTLTSLTANTGSTPIELRTTIGSYDTNGNNPWDGYLAHVAIWNTPADADIIALATP